ncbi:MULTISPECIES: aminotransferase [Priestia]|jgi:aminotransferase|uniref:Aminotransferase n=6 Tax=Priestia TaxID=2800373 RepID=D5DUN8_PRIM1|nr:MULTISPECIES: aminotransferase [Priestia]AVX10791.1 aromatic amino acid aminotransferase [Bacillus sp. Y-01]KOP76856.1 aromatic amino acid aminotransferase [Bacillus sp. FJAT-21351]KQU18344.1 aromatic amino acid aminotransferase [Bacillus sp. Leaf75]KRD82766.1 aromatic amino acid aminotransferase [Bacillus sp. Root147]KRF47676.1 aromatic amino acid aminotransferase [Bacillus sp. Soil531]MBK0294642.1 aminotransferase [Bacillus sp. S34]MBZ5482025.1 aminotransferase [Bacillus sp. T_4]MCF679
MKERLSTTVQQLKPSGIRRFFDLAASMDNVISLGVGEPDFVTSWAVREASILSLERGYTSYTANAGLLELRFEIMKYMKRNFNVSYDYKDDIIVTVGGSQALDITMRALINPEDEIIVVEPNFVSYSPLISLAGGVPVAIETTAETEFKLQPRQIEEVITSNTKALLLCSPNNPTGSSLSKEELQAIADIVIKHDLLVITDEIYAELTYDEEFTSIASLEGMKERTIIISGFSKGFAMTGWRLGYICAPTEIAKAMLKIHQYTMMCAPTMAQYGAIEALQNGQHDVEEMRKSYRRRRNYMVKSLNQIGLECHSPGGAFYVFPSIKKTGLSSEEFAEQLLLEERVAVVPGNVFGKGGEGHIRCSYASSMESLEESIKRISRFVENKL